MDGVLAEVRLPGTEPKKAGWKLTLNTEYENYWLSSNFPSAFGHYMVTL